MASISTRYLPKHRDVIMSGRTVPETPPGRYLDNAKAELAKDYVGVTTAGEVVPGLFSIEKTGVSTAPIKAAAEAFLAALSPEKRAAASFDADAHEWRAWSNIHVRLLRHGAWVEEMSETERAAAHGLLQATLSAAGYELARNAMHVNEAIAEITNNWESYGEFLYWVSIYGTPSDDQPWGWQIDGHHLVINCFVLGDQVVMTPTFIGGEPVYVDAGKYAGLRIFATEEAKGLELMRALTPAQQAKATVGMELPFDGFASGFHDNFVQAQQGVRYDELSAENQRRLVDLIALYIGRMRDDHAAVKMEEVKKHLNETYFAWLGGHGEEDAFYYQIYSPVVWIEFDDQPGVALAPEKPTRDHIHTIIRTPNGNDYGKSLLAQHYALHHHHH